MEETSKVEADTAQPDTAPTSLRARTLLACTLPVALVAVILTLLLTLERFQELDEGLENQGMAIVSAYGHALQTLDNEWDQAVLDKISKRILEEDHVRSVSILDTSGVERSHAGPLLKHATTVQTANPTTLTISSSPNGLRLSQPLYRDTPANGGLTDSQGIGGWLIVELDHAHVAIAKYRSILYGLMLLSTALGLNLLLAFKFGGQLRELFDLIRAAVTTPGQASTILTRNQHPFVEVIALRQALMELHERVTADQLELQQNVDQYTADLNESIETIEIQSIELDLARKQALQASQSKSEFLANMSHEIRTPLNGILGFTNVLLKTDLSATQQDYLSTIRRSSESLLSILNEILDFSKIEAGKLVLDQMPLSLRDLLEEVQSMLAPLAHEKGLEQISHIYSDVPAHIMGDPLRLKQILTNLLTNAIKFTETGEVSVRVMVDESHGNRNTIRLSVTDTGIGLTPAQQESLFQPFQQADASTARRFGGTGLGLVITKRLVEQMRGAIGVDSERGKGSTFWITFQAEVYQSEPLDRLQLTSPIERVGIFEAHPTLRNQLHQWLSQRQIKVTEYDSLTAMTTPVKDGRNDCDVLIVALSIRDPQYRDLTRLLEANRAVAIPIIVMGSADQLLRLDGHLQQARAQQICKPFASLRLLESLNNAFEPAVKHVEFTADSATAAAPIKNTGIESDRDGSPLILAVDDNEANLKLITTLLQDLQVRIIACDSGEKALAVTQQEDVDLVLMDIQMPGMDGVATTQAIRAKEQESSHVPIVAVTAHALEEEKQRLLQSGLDDYVTKPVSEAQLAHIVRKWTHWQPSEPRAETERGGIPVSHAPVNEAMGLRLANNKPDLARDMLDMLYQSLLEDRNRITQLTAARDISTLHDTVHKLHGATQYTGVPYLRQASAELLQAIKLRNSDEITPLTHSLLAEINSVIDWYQDNRSVP